MSHVSVEPSNFWSNLVSRVDPRRFRLGFRSLALLLIAEVLVLALLQIPLNLSWSTFAFMDQGANLAVQTLLDRHLVPTVDFGYTYGMLPLLIGRVWFRVLGLTPGAYAAAMVVVDLLVAWGLVRCLAALEAGPAGVALVIVAMPWAALSSYINLAHAIEAVLICHALAEHAAGRKPRALAILTACLFVKPTMAYVYGFFLTVLIIRDGFSGGIRNIIRSFGPAALTAVVLLAICGGWFGFRPLATSLFPVAGAANYKALDYGFFRGIGRRFWLPDNVWPTFYLVTPAGQYLVGTLVLLAAALTVLWRSIRRESSQAAENDELIACCGGMHLVFLTTFYADFMSWTYYYYILVIGLVAISARGRRAAMIVFAIAVLALVGDKYQFSWVKHQWKTTRPVSSMAGLWASDENRQDWERIRQIIGNRRTVVLSTQGEGLSVILPGYEPAETVFLSPGIPLPADLNRKLGQVRSTEFVLIAKREPLTFLDLWPEFRHALDGCEMIDDSSGVLLYRRVRPPE
jgi:hypothetical protein